MPNCLDWNSLCTHYWIAIKSIPFQLEIKNNTDDYTADLIERDIGSPNYMNHAFSAYGANADFQNVDLPIFINYGREEDFVIAKDNGITDFKKLVIAKYGKISAAQKVSCF